MTDYQYGVFYEGQGLGWFGCDSVYLARIDLLHADEKYLPGRIGRRTLGPIEYDFDWNGANNAEA